MDKQDLYRLDEVTYKRIQEEKRKAEVETKAYFDGMEKGADMMMKAVRDFLSTEQTQKGE